MATTFGPAEALRRRHAPDPVRDLLADYEAALAEASSDDDRRAVRDAVLAVAQARGQNSPELKAVMEEFEREEEAAWDASAPVTYRDGEPIPEDHALLVEVRRLLGLAETPEQRQRLMRVAVDAAANIDEARAGEGRIADYGLMTAVMQLGLPHGEELFGQYRIADEEREEIPISLEDAQDYGSWSAANSATVDAWMAKFGEPAVAAAEAAEVGA